MTSEKAIQCGYIGNSTVIYLKWLYSNDAVRRKIAFNDKGNPTSHLLLKGGVTRLCTWKGFNCSKKFSC